MVEVMMMVEAGGVEEEEERRVCRCLDPHVILA